MRWRFADRIDAFEPWKMIRGRKGISLEESSLLERFGRPGVMPESLVLEVCVHFARWLVAASSDWQESCLLTEIKEFVFESEARMGDNLRIALSLSQPVDNRLWMHCVVSADERLVAQGNLALDLVTLTDLQDLESMRIMWQELYEPA